MPRLVLRPTLTLTAALTALVLLVRAALMLSAAPLPMFTGAGCDAPCWMGVQPGETTLAELEALVVAAQAGEGQLAAHFDRVSIIQSADNYLWAGMLAEATGVRYRVRAQTATWDRHAPILYMEVTSIVAGGVGEPICAAAVFGAYGAPHQVTQTRDMWRRPVYVYRGGVNTVLFNADPRQPHRIYDVEFHTPESLNFQHLDTFERAAQMVPVMRYRRDLLRACP